MVSAPHETSPRGHRQGGALRLGTDEVPAPALTPPRQAHDARDAAGHDRLHGPLHPAGGHRFEDRPSRAPVRGLGQRPQRLDPEHALSSTRSFGTRSSIRTRPGRTSSSCARSNSSRRATRIGWNGPRAHAREGAGAARGDVRPGRVSAALLKELIPDPAGCVVYACGPAISAWDRQAARAAGTEPTPRSWKVHRGAQGDRRPERPDQAPVVRVGREALTVFRAHGRFVRFSRSALPQRLESSRARRRSPTVTKPSPLRSPAARIEPKAATVLEGSAMASSRMTSPAEKVLGDAPPDVGRWRMCTVIGVGRAENDPVAAVLRKRDLRRANLAPRRAEELDGPRRPRTSSVRARLARSRVARSYRRADGEGVIPTSVLPSGDGRRARGEPPRDRRSGRMLHARGAWRVCRALGGCGRGPGHDQRTALPGAQ